MADLFVYEHADGRYRVGTPECVRGDPAWVRLGPVEVANVDAYAEHASKLLAQVMIAEGLATGHGDTFEDLIRELRIGLAERAKWIAASERKPTASDLPIVFRQAGSRDHFCIDWPSELERVLNPRHENDRVIGLWFSLPKGPIPAARTHECGEACPHASDCAVHNAPAYPAGKCDCGHEINPSSDPLRVRIWERTHDDTIMVRFQRPITDAEAEALLPKALVAACEQFQRWDDDPADVGRPIPPHVTGPASYTGPLNSAIPDGMSVAEMDAARWRYARQFLAIEDVERWAEEMRGHQPDEAESAKTDLAIDGLLVGSPHRIFREGDKA